MAHPKPTIYSDFSDCPDFLKDFITYQRTIKGLSPRSVEAYYTDLKLFLRYVYQKRRNNIDFCLLLQQCLLALQIPFCFIIFC